MKIDRCGRRDFLKAAGVSVAAMAAGCWSPWAGAGRQRRRPNIVFIFSDDQRFDTIAALGNRQIVTPNMDRLVRNGTAMTGAYIMGSMSGAVCMPSRAMLLSGRTLFSLEGQGRVIPPGHVTFPELLRKAGYRTFATGKWHQDAKTFARCFTDGAKIFFGGMSSHFKVPVRDFDPTGAYPKRAVYRVEGKHSSELFTDAAISFLKSYEDTAPFLMYVSYTAPHDPREVPEPYRSMYKPEDIVLPKNFMSEHPFDNGEMRIRDEKLAPWPRTPNEIRKHIAAYYAMITHLDAQIGRLLEALRETGRLDNTIIVFSADNGLAVGRHGLLGKQNLYEHSVHVPLILSGPGIPKGRRVNGFCYLLDVYPTICELLGLAVPETVEGISLVPAILGTGSARKSLYFAYKDVQRAVRDGRFKLMEYVVAGKQRTQLFDLEEDPWEIDNLADSPHHQRILQSLRRQLLSWRQKLGDTSSFWDGYCG